MSPEKILHKKGATKRELRAALAEALGVSCPDFEHPVQTTFNSCKNLFEGYYEQKTGLDYSWSAKDSGSLSQILKKLHGIAKQKHEYALIMSFEYLLQHLPQWYVEKGLSLAVINSKFNEIISEIKNGQSGSQKSSISDSYKAGILRDLCT